jgi:hypothetical protein
MFESAEMFFYLFYSKILKREVINMVEESETLNQPADGFQQEVKPLKQGNGWEISTFVKGSDGKISGSKHEVYSDGSVGSVRSIELDQDTTERLTKNRWMEMPNLTLE